MDWAANDGFPEFMLQAGEQFRYSSAHQYRQRDTINLLLAINKGR